MVLVDWIASVPLSREEDDEDEDYSDYNGDSSSEEDYDDDLRADDHGRNDSSSYVVIDDMIIRKESSRAGLRDAAWPDGVVPYSFGFSLAPNQKTYIMQAMAELHEAVPCVSFRHITKEDTYNVEFRNDAMNQGCSSYVGWQNRKNQPIQLAAICTKGNAIHEIMHALGFFHEQTRDDRDEYVKINMNNVQPGYENNFKKDSELYPNADTDYFEVPYNYDSIMCSIKTYFSKNNQNTIDVLYNPEALGNGDNIGQREFISIGDIKMMRAKYNCASDSLLKGSVPDEEEGGEYGETTGEATSEAPTESTEAAYGGEEEGETTAAAGKPTTKNPICQINPNMPQCKQ